MLAAISPALPLRPCVAAGSAPPALAPSHPLLETAGFTAGAGLGAAAIGAAVATGGECASIPVASAVLNGYPGWSALGGLLYYTIFAAGGAQLAVLGATGVGLAVGILAAQPAPAKPGAIRRFLERPAAALRDAGANIAAAATRGDAARAGAHAGCEAGRTFGAVAGGIDGAVTGYGLGMLASGLFAASAPLAIATAVAGAAVGSAALCLAGRFIGGAMGAGVGALGGAALYHPTAPRTPTKP